LFFLSVTATGGAQKLGVEMLTNEFRDLLQMGNYDCILDLVTSRLLQLETEKSAKEEPIQRERLSSCFLASLNAYKGLALQRQQKWSTAVCFLRESQRLQEFLTTTTKVSLNKEVLSIFRAEEAMVDTALGECLEKLHVMKGAFQTPTKYPRTAHLIDPGETASTTDDIVLNDLTSVAKVLFQFKNNVFIEEKIDGANLGFSKNPLTGEIQAQNRSHFISQGDHAQFHRIPEWIAEHEEVLHSILQGGNRILYGEWVVARHSIPYEKLPGLFVAFDLYDLEAQQFYSRRRFHTVLKGTDIPVVPLIQKGLSVEMAPQNGSERPATELLQNEFLSLLETESKFRSDGGKLEGIVLRVDTSDSKWLSHKYKVVRPDFVGGLQEDHWASRLIEKQSVDLEFARSYLDDCYLPSNV
jgi:hypothetical protein